MKIKLEFDSLEEIQEIDYALSRLENAIDELREINEELRTTSANQQQNTTPGKDSLEESE
jgi:hypothetical protein